MGIGGMTATTTTKFLIKSRVIGAIAVGGDGAAFAAGGSVVVDRWRAGVRDETSMDVLFLRLLGTVVAAVFCAAETGHYDKFKSVLIKRGNIMSLVTKRDRDLHLRRFLGSWTRASYISWFLAFFPRLEPLGSSGSTSSSR